jgi:hypothetical protein
VALKQEVSAMDLFFLALAVAFFLASGWLLTLLDHL